LSDLIEVGYTKKPKGIEGYLKLHIDDNYISDIASAKALFLDLDGSQVPFLIEKFIEDGQLMIKLDEVDTPQQASLYCAKTAYLHPDEVSLESQAEPEETYLVGYTVIDAEDTTRGIIEAILDYPNQVMAEVHNERPLPFLLPIHEDQIIGIDDDAKTIKMYVPDGIEELV